MDVLYCLAMKSGDRYEERSVHPTFNSALISIYDIALIKFRKLLDDLGPEKVKPYMEDLKDINSLRKGYEPDNVTFLFHRKFKITKVKNMLTSKDALINILEHINTRFEVLRNIKTTKKICFPLELLDERVKDRWYEMDQYNAGEVIEHLEIYIQKKIDELKFHNVEVIQGILERNNEDFIAVRFTDSQEYLLNGEIFGITVSPSTGFGLSLTPS